MLTNKQEIIFFSFLGFLLILFSTLIYIVGNQVMKREEALVIPNNPPAIAEAEIKAKAAFVLDTKSNKVLFAKNEDKRLPLASLTKVMSALVASESAKQEFIITVTSDALKPDGDAGLVVGEKWRMKDLLDFSLISSANDGVRAISLSLGTLDEFVAKMNTTASLIGMKNTYYLNDTGLDLEGITLEKAGAYGTAKDQALLMRYILEKKPELLSATKESSMKITSLSGQIHSVKNTNSIVNSIPGIVASKTGFTDLAGGNLLVAYDPEIGRPVIIAILGSTEDGRFEDMQKLVDLSLKSVQNSVILKQ